MKKFILVFALLLVVFAMSCNQDETFKYQGKIIQVTTYTNIWTIDNVITRQKIGVGLFFENGDFLRFKGDYTFQKDEFISIEYQPCTDDNTWNIITKPKSTPRT